MSAMGNLIYLELAYCWFNIWGYNNCGNFLCFYIFFYFSHFSIVSISACS